MVCAYIDPAAKIIDKLLLCLVIPHQILLVHRNDHNLFFTGLQKYLLETAECSHRAVSRTIWEGGIELYHFRPARLLVLATDTAICA